MALADPDRTQALLVAASTGNTLGSASNWLLGRFLLHFRDRRWFPASPAALERAGATFRHYGLWSLLLAWLPVIGDPLTIVAGMLRTPFLPFVVLVAIGKTARYATILWAMG
ncbi:MAG: DedA family protein [Geminicoccaceae bacterium]|nr:DedA family protein [Geminicoccaceae bacterium]